MTQKKGKNQKRKLLSPEELTRELEKARSIDNFYGKDGLFTRFFKKQSNRC